MIQLIPLPKKVSQLTGTFRLTQDTSCYFAPELQETFHFFKDLVEKAARFPLQKGNEMADIRFLYDTRIPEEGYQLDCTQSGIAVFSSTPAGAFYAVQTLRQLLKLDVSKNAETLSMACVKIEDAPRFRWRGMMLDSSRYFWSVDYVKRYLDFMAMHKLNVFHWHLTDDAGWRIEIKNIRCSRRSALNARIHSCTAGKANGWRESPTHPAFTRRSRSVKSWPMLPSDLSWLCRKSICPHTLPPQSPLTPISPAVKSQARCIGSTGAPSRKNAGLEGLEPPRLRRQGEHLRIHLRCFG